jgi:hypothetical protein
MPLIPDMVLVFRLDGVRKELHFRKLPFSAWSELKAQLNFTPLSMIEAAGTVDLEAIGAIIWLERKQRERQLRWNTVRQELEHMEDSPEFQIVGVINAGRVEFGEEAEVLGSAPPADDEDPTTAAS